MKRFTLFIIMLALLMGTVPAALAAEPEPVNCLDEGVFSYRYAAGGKLGLMDQEGNILTEPLYDKIEEFSEGYAQVRRDERWGLIDKRGKVCVPLEYERLGSSCQGVCVALKNGKYGYLHAADGSPLTEFIYDGAHDFWGCGRVVNDKGGVGAVNTQGRLVVPMEYSNVELSSDAGRYITEKWVGGQGYYGAYDLEGNLLYPCEFANKERLLKALVNGGDSTGEVERVMAENGLSVTWYPECEALTRIYGTDRMALVKGARYALYGLDGTKYTEPVFDAIGAADSQGRILAAKGGKWGFIDGAGKAVIPFEFASSEMAFSAAENGVKFVTPNGGSDGPYALAKLDGTLLTDYQYWAVRPFSGGYARVADGQYWTYLDTQGRELFECGKYYWVMEDFGKDGYVIVESWDEAAGHRIANVLDPTGRELFPPAAQDIWRAGEGMWGYRDKDSGLVGFFDGATGAIAIPPQYTYWQSMMRPGGMMGNIFQDGVATVYTETFGEPLYIDVKGNPTDKRPSTGVYYDDGSQEYHEGLRWTDPQGDWAGAGGGNWGTRWGFEDQSGSRVIPCVFDAVGYFDRGYASVRLDGIYGLLKNPLLEDEDAHRVSGWAAAEVAAATGAGYVTPRCSTYQTHAITRLQFAELAVNYLEKATGETIAPAPADTFTDTTDGEVLKAYAAGIVQGVGEGRFDPGGPLTREQLATMLWRAMTRAGMAAEDPADLTAYTDGAQVSGWAQESLSALAGLKIMEGTGENSLSPQASCTVEQAILLIYRSAGR